MAHILCGKVRVAYRQNPAVQGWFGKMTSSFLKYILLFFAVDQLRSQNKLATVAASPSFVAFSRRSDC